MAWEDVPHEGSLQDFAAQNRLNPHTLEFAAQQAIVLPRNREFADAMNEHHLFAAGTKEVTLVLRESGLNVRLYEDGTGRRELVLKSADVLHPILLFAGKAAATVGLGILANWIYGKWIKKREQTLPSMKVEYAVLAESGRVERWRRIEGPADEVRRLLVEESKLLQSATQELQTPKSNLGHDDSDAPSDSHSKKEAKKSLTQARKLIEKAKQASARKQPATAESLFRKSLEKIREACLWEPSARAYQEYLHKIGKTVHDTFGCRLPFRDGQYWVSCPVQLSHNRVGLSIGGSATVLCSICGEDNLICPHVKGRKYDGVSAVRLHGHCNICTRSKCRHKAGKIYDHVEAIGIVTDINLDHVALVKNPAHPLCVVNAHSLSESDLLDMLPADERGSLVYGKTIIHCHHCVLCTGS